MLMSNKSLMAAALLCSISAAASAAGVEGFAGAGVGSPTVAYGSSGVALKIFGGAQVARFPLPQAGDLDLAIQGEFVDFGNSSVGPVSWSNRGFDVAAIGSWVIPKKWAGWADEKVAVIAKLGGARVATSSNSGLSYTYTGLTGGLGAEYRFTPVIAVRAMYEYFPSTYDLVGISGVFRF